MPREKRRRRSIEHDAPNYFVGWDTIQYYLDLAKALDLEKDTNEYSLYYVVLFETGGREAEVLPLKPNQVRWDEESIIVERMEVLKRRKRFTRDVYIKIDDSNPLASIFIDFVEKCETDYLLPARARFSREIIPNKHTSASTVYNKICAIFPDIWPHWIRDQRAWHLAAKPEEGGRDLDPYDHRKWFEWARMDMPLHYVGRRTEKDMMRALGIKKIPTGRSG